MTQRGADIIVDYLVENNVPYALGVCGHGNIQLLDALRVKKEQIKTLTTHHESAAGFMADAYFRVNHQPLVTFSSTGPGSFNMPIALANAMADSSAFLSITSDVPTEQFNRGAFQETGWHNQQDFPLVTRSYVKRVFQPLTPGMIPMSVRQAYQTMIRGRFGPVNLVVPFDLFVRETPNPEPALQNWTGKTQFQAGVNKEGARQVYDMLSQANQPVILAGNGVVCSQAEDKLKRLAYLMQIPVVFTPLAKGVIDMENPLAAGIPGRLGSYGGNEACRQADVLLTLGCRFDDRVASSWLQGYTFNIPPTHHIQVDISAEEIGRNYPIDLGLASDISALLDELIPLAEQNSEGTDKRSAWITSIQSWKTQWNQVFDENEDSTDYPVRPERLIKDLRSVAPVDTILAADVGIHHNWLVQLWQPQRSRSFLQAWGFGAMGFGVCGILGAKLAAPNRPCVAVVGDGGFAMHAHVVATAVEYNLPVVWVVWNNQGYCSIRAMQRNFYGEELATSFIHEPSGNLYTPNFAAMAQAMGAEGIQVQKPNELKNALDTAIKSNKPYVVEVSVQRDAPLQSVGTWELPPFGHPEPSFPPKKQ